MRAEGRIDCSREIPDFREIPLRPRAQRAVEIAQQCATWVAHHWLALANGVFLMALLGAAAVPTLKALGFSWLADPLFALYHLVCHQQPDRSFQPFGYPMAFCQRDTAVYGSIALAGIAFSFVRGRLKPLPWKWYLLAMAPIGIDGMTQLLGIRESNWVLRLLTGGIFGLATVWLAYPCLHRFAEAIIEDAGTGGRGDTGMRGQGDGPHPRPLPHRERGDTQHSEPRTQNPEPSSGLRTQNSELSLERGYETT